MTINEVAKKLENNKIRWRGHASKRMLERGVKRDDVLHTLLNGEIIEQYPDDFPFPSCLIFGYDMANKPLHVVCGLDTNHIWVITVYRPDPMRWEKDFKTRKAKK